MLGFGNYFYRLVPANPILLRVVQTASRRKRDLAIRCAYLGLLLFVVIMLLLNSAGGGTDLAALAKESGQIFWWMSYVQLGLVALLSPIFTAGAITQEKDSQTYDILLSTPLSNGQIVLGSLLSRLFFVVALLISGIPIFAITQIFGGVSTHSILLSCLIACSTAFVTGSLAMAIAVFKVGTRRTIFSFYLFIMLYLAIPMALEQMGFCQYRWNFDSQGKALSHISWFAGIHPFLALQVIFGDPAYRPPEAGMVQHYGWPMSWYLSSPHTFYISLTFLLSFLLIVPSILFLRRLAQSTYTLRAWLLQLLHLSTGDRTRRPRRVWSNPIAWREAKTRASANRAVVLRYGFMTLGIAAAVVLLVLSSSRQQAINYVSLGFNPSDKTVAIVDGGQTTLYRIRTDDESNPTVVHLGDRTVGPSSLIDGVEVVSVLPEAGAAQPTLKSISVIAPQTLLADKRTRQFLLGLIVIEMAIILLILTQSAASTVTREKEDGTLDLLLSTPITSRYYIWGKLRGLVSFVMPLLAVPVASVLLFVIRDLFRSVTAGAESPWIVFPEAIFILPATLVMISAFAAILGMQMSLRCRRTIMAVMSSVGIVGGICGALWACGLSAVGSSSFDKFGLIIGSFSPFTLMQLLVNPFDTAGPIYSSGQYDMVDSRVFVFFAGYAAAACYAMIVWAMYRSMVHNFDMTIRKQAM